MVDYFYQQNFIKMSDIQCASYEILTRVNRITAVCPDFFHWVKLGGDDTLVCNNIRPNYGNLKWAIMNGKRLEACSKGQPQKIQRKNKLSAEEIVLLKQKNVLSAMAAKPAAPKSNSKPASTAKGTVTPQ